MKRTIAIACGGDTSEFEVSLRSAQGIYSFIDKEKYTLYIVEMHGLDWHVQLPDGTKAPVDRNDFSFRLGGEKVVFDFVYITIHGTPGEDGRSRSAMNSICAASRSTILTFTHRMPQNSSSGTAGSSRRSFLFPASASPPPGILWRAARASTSSPLRNSLQPVPRCPRLISRT